MKISVHDEKAANKQTVEFGGTTVKELLKQLGINPQTVLVTRGSEVLLSSDTLKENDSLVLLSVISGG